MRFYGSRNVGDRRVLVQGLHLGAASEDGLR